jgi:hypothetical protein
MFGFNSLLGLPVHVLIVHLAVVLVPLAATAFIGLGWRPAWRARFSLPLAGFAVVAAGSAFLAAQTGGSLKATIRSRALAAGTRANLGDHPGSGNRAEIFAILLAAGAITSWLLYRQRDQLSLPTWISNALYAGTSLVALVAILTMVIAGHSGAALVWKDLGNYVSPR